MRSRRWKLQKESCCLHSTCISSGVISESELKRNLQDFIHQILNHCSVFEVFIMPHANLKKKNPKSCFNDPGTKPPLAFQSSVLLCRSNGVVFRGDCRETFRLCCPTLEPPTVTSPEYQTAHRRSSPVCWSQRAGDVPAQIQVVVSGLSGAGVDRASGLVFQREKFLQWVMTDNLPIFLTASSWGVLRVPAHRVSPGFCRSSKTGEWSYFSLPISGPGWWRCVGEGTTHHSRPLCKWKTWPCFAKAQNSHLQSLKQRLKWSCRFWSPPSPAPCSNWMQERSAPVSSACHKIFVAAWAFCFVLIFSVLL